MFASCKCVTASVYADLVCCLNAKESQLCPVCSNEQTTLPSCKLPVCYMYHKPVLIRDVNLNVLQVRKYVMEEVNKAGKAKKLRGFEMIKSVLLDEEAWSGKQAPSYPTSAQRNFTQAKFA